MADPHQGEPGSLCGVPSKAQLVEQELAVLRKVTGVTSVRLYERQRRELLNKTSLVLRMQGIEKPIVIHCKMSMPRPLDVAYEMIARISARVGEEAVADARSRAAVPELE